MNGAPLPAGLAPLGPTSEMPDAEVELDGATYAVLPSTLRLAYYGNDAAHRARMLLSVGVVPEEAIRGRVLLRVRPWGKFGRLGGAGGAS